MPSPHRKQPDASAPHALNHQSAPPKTQVTGRPANWTPTPDARDKLETLASDLRRALRVREEFLAIAGHELRTPLTALQLQIQGLRRTMERSDSAEAVLWGRKLDRAVSRRAV